MKPSITVPAVLLLASLVTCDHGVKTRHAYSASASGSNSFSSGFASSGASDGSLKIGVGENFWWAGPNSPFQDAYEFFRRCSEKGDCGAHIPGPFTGVTANIPNNLPQNGCNDNGCSFSGDFNVHDKQQGANFGPIDISKNPFLNGEYQGIAVSSCSGNACPGGKPHSTVTTTNCKGSDCKTNTQHGTSVGDLNLSQNPFLNGAFGAAGAFGGSGKPGAGCAGVKGGCKGAQVPSGGAGCNGAPGCTSGSSSFEYGYQGQIGGQGQHGSTGQIGGGSGCGPSGCSRPTGSYGGQGGSTSFTGSFSGSGSQPGQFVGGCAGTLGGCKPGQTSGGYDGSTSFTGGAGQGQHGSNIPTSYPGQTTGHGSTSGSFTGSGSTTGTVIGGCAGTLGGCKPGQTTGGYGGSTSFTGSNAQGQPGSNTPTSYPGQKTDHGSTSGSFSGSGSTSGSFGGTGQGFNTQTSYPGQKTDHGSTSGSFSGSGSTTGTVIGGCAGTLGGCKPGQPGYNTPTSYPGQNTDHGSTSGSFSGSGSTTGTVIGGCAGTLGGCKPGQSGYNTPTSYPGQNTDHGSTSGSFSGSGSTSGSFAGTGHGQPSYGQNIPTSQPGQTTSHIGTGSYSGSTSTKFTGSSQTGFTQSVPSTYPGQSGASGQPGYEGQPGQDKPGQPGYDGQPSQGQPGYTGSTSQPTYTGGSQTTAGSFSGSFGGSKFPTTSNTFGTSGSKPSSGQPGQQGYPGSSGQPGQQGHPGTSGQPGQQGYPGSSGQPGQQGHPGSFGQPGYTSGITQHGQTTSGSFAGSTSGSFGTSGYNTGSQHTQTTSGSFGGAGSTSGTYNQPGYTSGTQQTGGFPGSTGSFGSTGSYAGSGSFTGKTTPAGGNQGSPSDGQFTLKCYGEGLICVKKHLCNNGILNTDGEGLLHVRNGEHFCDVNTESCCKIPNKSGHPYKDTTLVVPGFPGGSTSFQTTNSHKSSSSSSASSSATSGSFGSTTQFGHNTSPTDIGSRFTPGPTAGGVQPGGVKPNYNLPGQVPSGGYQPGQNIPFGGAAGLSPGVIQVIPDGQTGTKTNAPGLTRPGLQQFGPGEAPELRTTPGLQQFGPGQAPGLRTTPGYGPTTPRFGVDVRPHGQSTPSVYDAGSDVNNELSFASTLQGPAYLPPGPSPSPSPSSYSPDLLPPDRSPTPTPPRPSTYYTAPTSPPTNYYPTQKTTPAYLPPFSGSQTTGTFVQTTKKPQDNGYLPPQTPSETNGDSQYLPPPDTKVPDSNIINVNVLRPTTPKPKPNINQYLPPGDPDRDPEGTNGQEFRLRPTTRRTTDFGNTTPYPGCAAALKCVEGEFCTADGTISKTRVFFTPEQENNRVPLTECSDPESGIIGKCCRDPEYKDPWPSTQLGLFNPDQDFQGSNPGSVRQPGNDGKYRPPKPQPGVKGGRPGGPRPGVTRPINPYEPNQIGSPSNNPNSVIRPGGYPSNTPDIPFDSRLVNVPVQIDDKPPLTSRFDSKFPTSPAKNSDTCGVRHPDARPAGPGPIDAGFGEIPWQAMILRDTNRSLLCGGAIIRRDVILTAAHCVENLQAADVLVKGGEWKLGIDEEPKPFQIEKVAAIVRHPGYRPENRFNDVALLILQDKFRLDRNVDTLCLPDPDEDVAKKFQNAKCITTGWGKTILQLNIVNSIMHILGVGIVQGSQCQQQLQQYHANSAHLYNTNCVCGAPVNQKADICDVDVGSALACEGPDGRYTLAGVYSWDTGCNPTAQVAGYTRVDTHWVQQTLQRPIKDLKTEESGFYQQLAGQECHCLPGKK